MLFTHALVFSLTALAALAIVMLVASQAWHSWLALKERELALRGAGDGDGTGDTASPTGARIEIADLKARIRKLEAIASGVDL
ncbi:MAG: hypothetical protein WA954_11055 [Parerythrobacter sp.]